MLVESVVCTVYSGNFQSLLDERMGIRRRNKYLLSAHRVLGIVLGMYYMLGLFYLLLTMVL